jgi:hypothetical protein
LKKPTDIKRELDEKNCNFSLENIREARAKVIDIHFPKFED